MKKFLFKMVLFILVLVLLEVFSFLFLALLRNSVHPLSISGQHRQEASESPSTSFQKTYYPFFMRGDSLHPYMGFTGSPNPADSFGFYNDISPLQKRSPSRFLVGITGGSVAMLLHEHGLKALHSELVQIPALANKEIIFINVALGGFKQPQQLMALNYFLSLGAEYDLLINIDGFNEMALPLSDNIPRGISPVYPRKWFERIGSYSYPKVRLRMLLGNALKQGRAVYAKFFSLPLLSRSFFANLIWEAGDHLFLEGIYSIRDWLSQFTAPRTHYEFSGPDLPYRNEHDLYLLSADVWAKSSQLMAQVCQANQILYFHFLQPNQYFPGTKTLSDEEKKMAYKENHIYGKFAAKGYPFLKQKTPALTPHENYRDFSMLFSSHTETLYVDDCCHYTPEGYSILAKTIGQAIREKIQSA